MKRGAFSLKQKHATEWRLTEFPCDVTNDIASKDFMRWKPAPAPQNTVSPQTTSVPVAKPLGTCTETEGVEKVPVGTCSETVEPDFPVSRFQHRYTDKLPGEGEPIGETRRESSEGPGLGHNQGPPLEPDDLSIPKFLRRTGEAA